MNVPPLPKTAPSFSGRLWVIATPIGNLNDLSPRSQTILAKSDFIIAENINEAKKLLSYLALSKPVQHYHDHVLPAQTANIIRRLAAGASAALLVSRGTPGLADPGGKLTDQLWRLNEQGRLKVKISPVPGPSALTAALSVCGFPANRFAFFGFPPKKKGRRQWFGRLAAWPETAVFFESPYRVLATLEVLCGQLKPGQPICVARELTKKFEEVLRGSCAVILAQLKNRKQIKGEFTVVVGAPSRIANDHD